MNIQFTIGSIKIEGLLNDTQTAQKVKQILPIKSSFDTWGEEIYFTIPVDADLDESVKEEVELGDLGFWPPGKAFCIFFGQTPNSSPGKIVPASAVNIIGKITGDAEKFKGVMAEKKVVVDAV